MSEHRDRQDAGRQRISAFRGKADEAAASGERGRRAGWHRWPY